jgi:hypothetical protein
MKQAVTAILALVVSVLVVGTAAAQCQLKITNQSDDVLHVNQTQINPGSTMTINSSCDKLPLFFINAPNGNVRPFKVVQKGITINAFPEDIQSLQVVFPDDFFRSNQDCNCPYCAPWSCSGIALPNSPRDCRCCEAISGRKL